MNKKFQITRRDWLRLLSCIAVEYGLLGSKNFAQDETSAIAASPLDKWVAQFPEVAEIGKSYLQLAPFEIDRMVLLEKIFSMSLQDLQKTDPADLTTIFLNRVEKDFENDTTVDIAGWILSQTECRACALTQFMQQKE